MKKGNKAIYHMCLPSSWLVPLMRVCLVSYMPAGTSKETLYAENISDLKVIKYFFMLNSFELEICYCNKF